MKWIVELTRHKYESTFFLNQNSIKQVAMGSFKSNCIVRREKVYLVMLLTNHLKENTLNM